MGKSEQRDIYFVKHIEGTETADDYIEALKNSPYAKHQRIGQLLETNMLPELKMKIGETRK